MFQTGPALVRMVVAVYLELEQAHAPPTDEWEEGY